MKVLVLAKDVAWLENMGSDLYGMSLTPVFCDNVDFAIQTMKDSQQDVSVVIIGDDLDVNINDLLQSLTSNIERYIYMIVVKDGLRQEEQWALLENGADQVWSNQTSYREKHVHMKVVSRIMEHQRHQQNLQDNLWNQANYDLLTEIPNRRSILRSLDRLSALGLQRNQPLGLLMIDLDHFKNVNDTFGHDGGDVVLKETAARMSSSLRTSDLVGRFGGEEFLVIIPNCMGEELTRLAERIRVFVNRPIQYKENLIPVSCSIGASVYFDSYENVQEALKRADKALYVAKEMGRNRVVCAWLLNKNMQKIS